jgi:hypothetical protein
MWENIGWFILGALIAGPVGFLACALLTVAKVSDSQDEATYHKKIAVGYATRVNDLETELEHRKLNVEA